MAESEKIGGQPASALLLDMGRSEARRAAGCSSEDQLMRFADDPLGIRDFLRREETPHQAPLSIAVLAGETAIVLSREGSSQRADVLASVRVRYPSPEPLEEVSIVPTAFSPSRDDQVGALDHESRLLADPVRPGARLGWNVAHWIGLAAGTFLLTLVTLAF